MGLLTHEMMAQREVTSNWGPQYKHPVNAATGAPQANPIALLPSPAEDVARIRHVLNPTVLELANLFGVSRQTVYDWQAGAQPNAQAETRLAQLARAADVFAEAGVTINTQTLRRKVSGGATILGTVLNGGNAVHLAQSLVGTLKREEIQRERIAQQLAGRERGHPNSSDYGAPSLAENA
jgi:DNA-binding transcriptional regulator YiaG